MSTSIVINDYPEVILLNKTVFSNNDILDQEDNLKDQFKLYKEYIIFLDRCLELVGKNNILKNNDYKKITDDVLLLTDDFFDNFKKFFINCLEQNNFIDEHGNAIKKEDNRTPVLQKDFYKKNVEKVYYIKNLNVKLIRKFIELINIKKSNEENDYEDIVKELCTKVIDFVEFIYKNTDPIDNRLIKDEDGYFEIYNFIKREPIKKDNLFR